MSVYYANYLKTDTSKKADFIKFAECAYDSGIYGKIYQLKIGRACSGKISGYALSKRTWLVAWISSYRKVTNISQNLLQIMKKHQIIEK